MSDACQFPMPATWRDAVLHMSPAGYIQPDGPMFDPNARDSSTTAVELAICNRRSDWLEALLEEGANPNDFLGSDLHTYGQSAIILDDHKAYSTLLQHGYRPDHRDRYDRNDAHYCALHRSQRCLPQLTQHPDLFTSLDRRGYTPYHYACTRSAPASLVTAILDATRADVPDRATQASAAHFAVLTHDVDIVEKAVARFGASSVDAAGNTPLHWAIPRGSYHVVLTLRANGAPADATNHYGVSPADLLSELPDPHQRAMIEPLLS